MCNVYVEEDERVPELIFAIGLIQDLDAAHDPSCFSNFTEGYFPAGRMKKSIFWQWFNTILS